MAKYKVTDESGGTYEVEGPEGTSEQALRAAVQNYTRGERLKQKREDYNKWLRGDIDIEPSLDTDLDTDLRAGLDTKIPTRASLAPQKDEWLFGEGGGRGIDLIQQILY